MIFWGGGIDNEARSIKEEKTITRTNKKNRNARKTQMSNGGGENEVRGKQRE